jgi:hypothetical protein
MDQGGAVPRTVRTDILHKANAILGPCAGYPSISMPKSQSRSIYGFTARVNYVSPVKACAWRSSLNSPSFRLRLSASQTRSWSAELQQIDSQLPSVRSPWTRIAIPALTYRHHGRSCPCWWVVIWSGLLRNHSSYILASCPPAEQVLLILRIPS